MRKVLLISLLSLLLLVGAGVAAKGPGFAEKPTADKIPTGPITGEANGRPFEAKTVVFEPRFGVWQLTISDRELKSPTDFISKAKPINIELPEPPAAGKTYDRALKYGGGYWQIQKSDDPEDTTSWNAENAYVLELTEWDVKPYDPNGDMVQVAGKAAGRIYIVYKGSERMGIKPSWAAGEFKDAIVRYSGEPRLEY